jgi:beta-galactosidase
MRSVLRVSLFAVLVVSVLSATAVNRPGRMRMKFNDGWKFQKGPAEGAERPEFDDSRWRAVRLPHDWAIAGPFDQSLNPHTGALPISGTGWYRKTFESSASDGYQEIEFDGAMANSKVWLNGEELGGRPYGYIGFAFDLTPHLQAGTNVLAVRLTPQEHSSRWYPGAGIYRNVWLISTGAVHVAHWGTYVTTPKVTDSAAMVAVRTEVANGLDREAQVTLRTTIFTESGEKVGSVDTPMTMAAKSSQTIATSLTLKHPQRWNLDHPYLYRLSSEILQRGRLLDKYGTPFGVRTIVFDREKGFLLNGKQVRLHGVCLHHDLGALGAAVNRRATERQLQIMQAGGVNAIRTSHNPPSPELLDLADQMGLLVMDELFDMWRIPKVSNGYSKYFDEWSERDLRDMVHRDRNHPSIIMWSIGNEIPEQKSEDGWKEAKRLTGFFREEDPTRPTTSAFNNWSDAIRNKLADNVDIPGFNYKPMNYEQILKEHPSWIIYGSETASCVSSRGTYHLPVEAYVKHPSLQVTSYDVVAPSWAYCPDVEFFYQEKLPNVLGEFVWTGFDYIGEPTPYFGWEGEDTSHDWPARSSYFGMVDLAGFPKDRYYLYQSMWTKKPMVHVLPHWNWEGREGRNIPVMVYLNGDEVELFLNGMSLGRKKRFSEPVEIPVGGNVNQEKKFTTKYRLQWQVPYHPGTLRAVAYQDGKQVAVEEIKTAGTAARIGLVPDRATIRADGDDLSFITVKIEDKDGNMCPEADNQVRFHVTGGEIVAVDNGNPATVEPFQADRRKAFNGLALVIVRSLPGKSGAIHVSASGEGLAEGKVLLHAK